MKLHDEVHDWLSTLPAWQQELFLRAVSGAPLSERSLDQVLDAFLSPLPGDCARMVRREDLPADLASGANLEVLRIEHRHGVNRLADGERLDFIPRGVNVVFGHNGSGKSGWARIPKHAGRARAAEPVLGDVFADPVKRPRPAALIDWQLAGSARRLELELDKPAPADLAGLCVFDAACGMCFLTDDHEVDYVPLALETIQRLARAQVALAERLVVRIDGLADPELPLDPYPADTRVHEMLSTLSDLTDLDELRRLASMQPRDVTRRDELARQLAELDGRNTDTLATVAERDAQQAGALARALGALAKQTGEEELAAARREAAAVEATQRVAAGMSSEQFATEPLSGVATEPWLVMWRAAEKFMAEVHGTSFPPDHDAARCPLCMQVLDEDAVTRLRNFGGWAQSDIEQQLAAAQITVSRRREVLPDVERLREIHSAVRGSLADQDEPLALKVEGWLVDAARVVTALRNGELVEVPPVGVCPATDIEAWGTGRLAAAAAHRSLQEPGLEASLRGEYAELRAREALAERLASIERRIERLRERARLESRRSDLKTGAISNRLRGFADGFVTEDLEKALHEQLSNLNFEDLEIVGCSTSGRGGTPRVGLKIRAKGSVPLRSVLSDGEQRRLALAFFLAEVTVAYPGSPVVIDDPVCSIDHQGRRHVAKTLARAAANRQVIVFTHELTFLHELQRETARAQVELHAQFVTRSGGRTGRVQSDLPWTGRTAHQRAGDLNAELQTLAALYRSNPDGREYEKRSATFCVNLRQAFERALEDDVLGGVVTRGDPGVHPNVMRNVAWSDEICHLSDVGMSDNSPWAHDQSRASNSAPPTPVELEEGLAILRGLLKATKDLVTARKKAKLAARSVPGQAAEPLPEPGEVRELPGIAGAA